VTPAPDRRAGPPAIQSLAGHGASVPAGADRTFVLSRDLLSNGFAALVALAVVAITYWRLAYGIDFTDESFYVAVPYRLVLGARPFIDETSVTQQTTALLVYPFVRAYDAVAGTTGIVLFVRHLQFVFSLLVGAVVFASVRLSAGVVRATLLALCCVAFVPFGIHSLSYDTLGSGLFTAGCFLGLWSLRRPRSWRTRLGAGLAHGLAVFAYPPLAIPVAILLPIRLAGARGHRRAEALAWSPAALGLPAAAMAALVWSAGPGQVISDYRRSSTYLGQAGGFDKLRQIALHEWTTLRWPLPLLVALVLLVAAWRRRRGVAVPLLLALPVLAAPTNLASFTTSLEYVTHFAALGPVLFWLVRGRRGAGLLFGAVWLPALVAGITTAYSSANGGVNFGIGFFPAALATTLFLVWAIEGSLRHVRRGIRRFGPIALAPVVAALAALVAFEIFPVYRDSGLAALATRVEHGPYAGLVTSRRKAAFLDRLERDLAAFGPSCRITFLKDFPAGYLLSAATPDTNGAWTATVATSQTASYQAALVRYYRRNRFPDVVVVMRRIPYAAGRSARFERDWAGEPVMAALRAHHYRGEVARQAYTLYRRASSTC
jgi:hypothetical protein